jgi:hypothetical protein
MVHGLGTLDQTGGCAIAEFEESGRRDYWKGYQHGCSDTETQLGTLTRNWLGWAFITCSMTVLGFIVGLCVALLV